MSREQLELLVDETLAEESQENFDRIRQYLSEDLFTKFDGSLFEHEFVSAVTNFKLPHFLGFLPRDLIVTSKIGAGIITFNYDKFSIADLDITTTGPVTVRFVAGSFVIDR